MSVFHVTTILAPDKKHRATEVVFHYKIVEQFLAFWKRDTLLYITTNTTCFQTRSLDGAVSNFQQRQ